ncbi:unnamed protein product [Caenorhabditis sp. 36 PRJEB53466]|nr:unnamed protein product [Caenorhabditis sp. 36 PRJEB53466]
MQSPIANFANIANTTTDLDSLCSIMDGMGLLTCEGLCEAVYKACCVDYNYCAFYKQTWFLITCIGGGVLLLIVGIVVIFFCFCKKKRGV